MKKLLDNKFFSSRIKSPNVKWNEILIGYFLGPCGAYLLNALFANYLNIYYTDVLNLTGYWNGNFLFLFPLLSAIVVAFVNVLFGVLIDKTKTSQGKARPYLFVSAFLLSISSLLLFLMPEGLNETGRAIWVVVTYNLFYAFSFALYNTSHNLMVPLSTRNGRKRSLLATVNNMASMLMAGGVAGFLFPSFVYPLLGSQSNWVLAMGIISCLVFPLTLLEYYFTRERITEESSGLKTSAKKTPYLQQLKEVAKEPYWWLMILYFVVYYAGSDLRNASLVYYCNWVLGTYSDGITITLLSIIGGLPFVLGLLVLGPLEKKLSKRWLMFYGFLLYVGGDVLSYFFPSTLWIVLVGQFIKNVGSVPCVYLFMSLYSDVLDHVEAKCGYRCDGISMSIYSIIFTTFPILANAAFNKLLSTAGYVAPFKDATDAYNVQNAAVKSAIVFSFIGIEIITASLLAIIMLFLGVEKNIKADERLIVERQKAVTLAAGKEWIEPEEKAKREQEALDKEAEQTRIKELKERCAKKGLSYQEEEAKRLHRKAKLDLFVSRFKKRNKKDKSS